MEELERCCIGDGPRVPPRRPGGSGFGDGRPDHHKLSRTKAVESGELCGGGWVGAGRTFRDVNGLFRGVNVLFNGVNRLFNGVNRLFRDRLYVNFDPEILQVQREV